MEVLTVHGDHEGNILASNFIRVFGNTGSDTFDSSLVEVDGDGFSKAAKLAFDRALNSKADGDVLVITVSVEALHGVRDRVKEDVCSVVVSIHRHGDFSHRANVTFLRLDSLD